MRNSLNRARRRRQISSPFDFLRPASPTSKRRSWTFERLEDRHYLSANPLTDSSAAATNAQIPTDPYFEFQWNLFNVGQVVNYNDLQNIFGVPHEDINVVPVWMDGITGQGVLIAVVDSGFELDHPDLIGAFNTLLSYNANTEGTDVSVDFGTLMETRGTAVAGLLAAQNNGEGIVGVAYGSTLMPIKLTIDDFSAINSDAATLQAIADAFLANGNVVDVYNHSWGPSDFLRGSDGVNGAVRNAEEDPLIQQAMQNVINALTTTATGGRGGLGAIHVFASGNGAGASFSPGFQDLGIWDSAGSNAFVNSRYTIGVGAVDHDGSVYNRDGTVTIFGEMGPSVLVVAPTASGPFDILSNLGTGSGIWTTDLTTTFDPFTGEVVPVGINVPPLQPSGLETDIDRFPDTDYTSRFGGTSAAAPMVSGVVALMLEANPNLSYRDVQEILVRSARQNDQFDTSWFTNLFPLFRDPIPATIDFGGDGFPDPDTPGDDFIWGILPGSPGPPVVPPTPFITYNPIATPASTPFVDALMTNGAGFTVSHGRMAQFASEYGYAHGVVDADLAVELAKQWHVKGQHLAPELSYVDITLTGSNDIQAGAVSNEESGEFRIPGGFGQDAGNDDGFIDFFNEFFEEPTVDEMTGMFDPTTLPFSGEDPPANTRGVPLQIDPPINDNAMSVEWVEVQLDISGDADALNYLRLTLVSPNGTHSELTNYQLGVGELSESYQFSPVNLFVEPPGSISSEGTFSWIYTTNRNWGERADVDNDGDGFVDPWLLHFENYSDSELSLDGLRVSFYGKPVAIPGENVVRTSGKVGVDGGRFTEVFGLVGYNDGNFNFDRYIDITFDPDNLPPALENADAAIINSYIQYVNMLAPYPGQMLRFGDPTQESFASNITVYARDLNGDIVAQFITGADGNFYFDLPEGDYTIEIDDPLGRNLQSGPDYLPQWNISVPDTFGYEISDLNFLLEAAPIPSSDVTVRGQVWADLDGDGNRDVTDTGVPNFRVYADLNHTGLREATEPFVFTDSEGNYELQIETFSYNTFSIGVEPIDGWVVTSPGALTNGINNEFINWPDQLEANDVDFGVKPPENPTGVGNGNVFGFVFEDKNGDGSQQGSEFGIGGVTIFIDEGPAPNGILDPGEVFTTTNVDGAFQFADVAPGTVRIVADIQLPYEITTPAAGYFEFSFAAGQVAHGFTYGVHNLAVSDFGDLVGDGFRTTLALDGPRHLVVPGFQLGAHIDAELDTSTIEYVNGVPQAPDPLLHGVGDDNTAPLGGADDEDGVELAAGMLHLGMNSINVTVNGVGGYLNAWFDLNDDGTFTPDEHLIVNDHKSTGTYSYGVDISAITPGADGKIAARFRWGAFGLDYFGEAPFGGEVEDYLFDSVAAQIEIIPGDFNGDTMVDDDDFELWIATYRSTVDLRADHNGNNRVDAGDYTIWRDHYGAGVGDGAGTGSSSSLIAVDPDNSSSNGSASSTASDSLATSEIVPSLSSELELHFDRSLFTSTTTIGTRSSFVVMPSSTSSESQTDLNLLDELLAEFAPTSEEDDDLSDEACFGSDDEDAESQDLALAAVFEDEAAWRL
jgi:subtilisin family serine protease